MQKVWKYPLLWREDPSNMVLQIPKAAEMLHFGFQNGSPFVWALVDPEADKDPRRFVILGTGHEYAGREFLQHIGTAFTDQEGTYVFHLFEKVSEF